MDEGLVDEYIKLLSEPGANKSKLLVQFYCTIFEVNYDNNLFIAISKLVKLYGIKRVFTAILSTYDVEKFNAAKPYPMLSWFCKKSLENVKLVEFINLDKLERKSLNKLKIGDPFA